MSSNSARVRTYPFPDCRTPPAMGQRTGSHRPSARPRDLSPGPGARRRRLAEGADEGRRRHHARLGPPGVVHTPVAVGLHRGVVVSGPGLLAVEQRDGASTSHTQSRPPPAPSVWTARGPSDWFARDRGRWSDVSLANTTATYGNARAGPGRVVGLRFGGVAIQSRPAAADRPMMSRLAALLGVSGITLAIATLPMLPGAPVVGYAAAVHRVVGPLPRHGACHPARGRCLAGSLPACSPCCSCCARRSSSRRPSARTMSTATSGMERCRQRG